MLPSHDALSEQDEKKTPESEQQRPGSWHTSFGRTSESSGMAPNRLYTSDSYTARHQSSTSSGNGLERSSSTITRWLPLKAVRFGGIYVHDRGVRIVSANE